MTISLVNEFQIGIYTKLLRDERINSQINQIYFALAQNAKYPFLLINILKIENLSRFGHYLYNVKFEICAYARDTVPTYLSKLADYITRAYHLIPISQPDIPLVR